MSFVFRVETNTKPLRAASPSLVDRVRKPRTSRGRESRGDGGQTYIPCQEEARPWACTPNEARGAVYAGVERDWTAFDSERMRTIPKRVRKERERECVCVCACVRVRAGATGSPGTRNIDAAGTGRGGGRRALPASPPPPPQPVEPGRPRSVTYRRPSASSACGRRFRHACSAAAHVSTPPPPNQLWWWRRKGSSNPCGSFGLRSTASTNSSSVMNTLETIHSCVDGHRASWGKTRSCHAQRKPPRGGVRNL